MSTVEKYGKFIPSENCFELKNEPPRKWVNLHYNEIGKDEIYAEITNVGDGPVWARDENGCKVHLVSYDQKFLYIRDEESQKVFNPSGQPVATDVENYSCKFYQAKTVISSDYDGIHMEQRVFVPKNYVLEAWTLKLRNDSDRTRKLNVFGFTMLQLNGCDSEGNGIGKDTYSEIVPDMGGVFVTNRNAFVPTDKFKGYFITLNEMKAANGYRDHFTRSDFSLASPRIIWGWNCDGRPGYGPDCAGIVQTEVELAPGEEKRVDYLLGQASSKEEVKKIRSEITAEKLDKMCEEQEQIELERSKKFSVETGNGNYDALINIFAKKQMYSYLINKSGFRDNMQIDYALSLCSYEDAKDNVLRALKSQYANGSVPHGFRPLNRLQYSDKPAWMLMTVPALIKESGDYSLLDVELPFFESEEKGSVLEHMLRAMRFLANDTGKNGLCNQHYADWNDGLEATVKTGERESVMVTQQLCYGLLELEELANRIAKEEIAKEARDYYELFKQRINEVAWDGEWYVRTICEDGYRIGSKENEEGKIFMNTQSWAILSKIADEKRAQRCMQSVDKLIEQDIGFQICNPGFSKYDPRIGRTSNSMLGAAENGGCYNHGAGFKGVADCVIGRAEEAWRTFVKVLPDNPENPITVSQAEPFSFNNFYNTIPIIYGSAGYPWRTGTAGWFTLLIVEFILGAKRHYDGLKIDPCLTKKIKHAKVKRTFRGAVYNIELDNSAERCVGATKITVDGKEIEGNIIPPFNDGEHEVKVVI